MAWKPEERAREFMLTPIEQAAYVRLMNNDRSEYQVLCPGCLRWVETYESDIVKHVRTCDALKGMK